MVPVHNTNDQKWVHLSCSLVFGEALIPDDRTNADLEQCEVRKKKQWVFSLSK